MYKRKRTAVIIAALACICVFTMFTMFTGCGNGPGQPGQGQNAGTGGETLSVGERVFFGSYPQSGEEPEPIEWRVLDIKDGRALLISEKLLDKGVYNDLHEKITWERCSLRGWLNSEFISKAFTPEEIKVIAKVVNKNPDNPVLFTEGGPKTEDRVFLLSISEAKKYFADDRERAAVPTGYAAGYGEPGDVIWWLRSPGGIGNHAAYVREDGTLNRMGYTIGWNIYIRPALWMEI